jgi:hypothetical protein
MLLGFFCILFGLVCLSSSSSVFEKQPNLNRDKLELLSFINKQVFYQYCQPRLLMDQNWIASHKQREHELELKLREEREKEIFQKRLANRVLSSFLRDFIISSY